MAVNQKTAKKGRKEPTYAELKAKAGELLKRADEMEKARLIRLGRVAEKFAKEGYADLEAFKNEVTRVCE